MRGFPESTQLKTLGNIRGEKLDSKLSPEDTQVLFELTSGCEL